jgi:hypothetical protein
MPHNHVKILLPKLERFKAVGPKDIYKWKDPTSIYSRLPEHYKKRHIDFLNTVPKPVHYMEPEKKFVVDHEYGIRKPTQAIPIPILYPTQIKMGIFGGEGVIPGYIKPWQTGFKRIEYLKTKLWRPKVYKNLFYSEILDTYYALLCTQRAMDLIEECKGFDNYILKVI